MKASKEYILELVNNLFSYVKPTTAFNENTCYIFEFNREVKGIKYTYSVVVNNRNNIIIKLFSNSSWLGTLSTSVDTAEYHKLMLKAYTVYDLYEEQLLKDIAVCPDGKDAFDKLVE